MMELCGLRRGLLARTSGTAGVTERAADFVLRRLAGDRQDVGDVAQAVIGRKAALLVGASYRTGGRRAAPVVPSTHLHRAPALPNACIFLSA